MLRIVEMIRGLQPGEWEGGFGKQVLSGVRPAPTRGPRQGDSAMAWPCAGASRRDARSSLLRVSRGRARCRSERCMGRDGGPDNRRGPRHQRGSPRRGARGHRRDRPKTSLPVRRRNLDGRRATHAARRLIRPGGDPLQDARRWAAVLGDAHRQGGARWAAAHHDVHRALGVTPGGDPAGRPHPGDAGTHCGTGVCDGEAGWGASGLRWMKWR